MLVSVCDMTATTRPTAAFAEMHRTMQAASGAVADGAGRELFDG